MVSQLFSSGQEHQKCKCGESVDPMINSEVPLCWDCLSEQNDPNQFLKPSINQIDEYLFISNKDVSEHLETLKQHKIQLILVAGSILEQKFPNDYKYLQFQIDDWPKQDISQFFETALKFIHKGRIQKQNVLVHCAEGVSRSASFVIAYLMVLNQWEFDKALAFVKEKRKEVSPNSGFIEQLKEFSEKLQKGKVSINLGESK